MFKPLPLLAHVAAGFLISVTMPALATDRAEVLYQTHCIQCHSSMVYTRPTRKISTFDTLERQVKRCQLSLGLQWFDEEIHAVTTYLNQQFYHFLR